MVMERFLDVLHSEAFAVVEGDAAPDLENPFLGAICRLEALRKIADDAAVCGDLGQIVAQRAVKSRLGEAGRPCAGIECVLLRGIGHAEPRIAALLGLGRQKRYRVEA